MGLLGDELYGVRATFEIGKCLDVRDQGLPRRLRFTDAARLGENTRAFRHPGFGPGCGLLQNIHTSERGVIATEYDLQFQGFHDQSRAIAETLQMHFQQVRSFFVLLLRDQRLHYFLYEVRFGIRRLDQGGTIVCQRSIVFLQLNQSSCS